MKYLIVLISLSLLIFAVFKFVPKPDQASLAPSLVPTPTPMINFVGWQEYTNEKYHYTIKYPHDWYFYQSGINPPPPTLIHLASVSLDKASSPHASVEVFVDKKGDQNLDNYGEIINLTSQGFVARKMTVDESKAVLIDNLGESGRLANLYIDHNDYIYRLGWNATHPDALNQFQDTCLKIIASIKFTD